jgi:hypothetical protein
LKIAVLDAGVERHRAERHIPDMTKHPKRPRDPNQLAKSVIEIATGDVEETPEACLGKRGTAGGQKGGPARSAALMPQQRSEIARAAAAARWRKG